MKAKKKQISYKRTVAGRASEMPVTVGIIEEFREETRASFRAHDRRFEAIDHKFTSIDHRFDSIDKRFASIDKRFDSIDHRFDSIDLKFASTDHKIESFRQEVKSSLEEVLAEVRRSRMITEEEKNRNNAVMDGYHSLYERQAVVEKKVTEFGNTIELFCKLRGPNEKKGK